MWRKKLILWLFVPYYLTLDSILAFLCPIDNDMRGNYNSIMQEGFRGGHPEVKLEDLGHGMVGRTIPMEERFIQPEQVEKLAQEAGGAFGDWIRDFYSKRRGKDPRIFYNLMADLREKIMEFTFPERKNPTQKSQ